MAGGIKLNWPILLLAGVVIAVPVGLALRQDLGKKEAAHSADLVPPPPPEVEAAPSAVVEAKAWQKTSMDKTFFDEVLGASRPVPGEAGIPASIHWGEPMMRQDASALREAVLRFPDLEKIDYGDPTAPILELSLTFPDDGTARQLLSSAWGSPTSLTGDDGFTRDVWLSRPTGFRAMLWRVATRAILTFATYRPIEQVYASKQGRFAFETRPVLGASVGQLTAAYGAAFHFDPEAPFVARLDCPFLTDLARLPASCTVEFTDGRADKLRVVTDHRLDPEAAAALFERLRSSLGAIAQRPEPGSGESWVFSSGVRVRYGEGSSALIFTTTTGR